MATGTGNGSRRPHEDAAAVAQARDNGGLDWMERSARLLEVEPAGLGAGLGIKMRGWSNWAGLRLKWDLASHSPMCRTFILGFSNPSLIHFSSFF